MMVSQYPDTEAKIPAARRTVPAPAGGSPSVWVRLFISCACMFVLGVLVGRNTAPVNFEMESLDKKLSQLPTSVLTEADAAGDPIAPDALKDIPFEFYDKLREEAPTPLRDEPGGPPPMKRARFEKKTASAVVLADATPSAEAKSDAPAVLKPAAKTPEPETIPEPAAPAPAAGTRPEIDAPAVSNTGYAIQVASLRDQDKADSVRDKFRSKGYPAYTQQAVVEGKGQWCRVRLGPYADKTQAENDLSRLQKAGVDAILFSIDTHSQ